MAVAPEVDVVTAKLYFEDLTEKKKLVCSHTVSLSAVHRFLQAVGSVYWHHIDDDVTPVFGQLVPPHMWPGILANASMWRIAWAPISAIGFRVIFAGTVRVDEELLLVEEIKSLTPAIDDPSLGIVLSRHTVHRGTADSQPLVICTAHYRVQRRPV